jgi:(2S)-methylsuccinyl-CoA dehydrogenase
MTSARTSLGAVVHKDGADNHQIEIDQLVWAQANADAAIALLEWARDCDDPFAEAMADVAYRHAQSIVARRGDSEALALDSARLVEGIKPTDDLGSEEHHRLLRSMVRSFANHEILPKAQQIHRQDLDVPERVIAGAAELGLFGLSIPLEFGGSQEAEDYVAMLIVTEELSRASLAAGGSLITRPEILVRALLKGGTEAQKRLWLPAIASGKKLVAVAVTEPDYGSDAGAIQCRATRLEDGDWEINGTKLWCTFAGRSELVMVLCRTSAAGHRGLSVFVVDKPAFEGHHFEYRQATGGVLIGRAIPTLGYRGMHTFELSFDGFRLPASALVGGDEWLDRGFYLQMEGFAMGRVQTAGRAVGVMQAAVEDALAYARSRHVFGKAILDNQLIRAKLGWMTLQLNASRQLSYRAARLLNKGLGQTEASLAKLYASRSAESVTREAMQIHGAMGYSEETDVSRYFVDARVLSIFEGADEVLSLRVIGKALMGERS